MAKGRLCEQDWVAALVSTLEVLFIRNDIEDGLLATEFVYLFGGIAYDARLKKWKSTTFNAGDKFILIMKFVRSRTQETVFGSEFVTDYNVSLRPSGETYASPCENYRSEDTKNITVGKFESFRCNAVLMDYIFNLKSNRFLVV